MKNKKQYGILESESEIIKKLMTGQSTKMFSDVKYRESIYLEYKYGGFLEFAVKVNGVFLSVHSFGQIAVSIENLNDVDFIENLDLDKVKWYPTKWYIPKLKSKRHEFIMFLEYYYDLKQKGSISRKHYIDFENKVLLERARKYLLDKKENE